MKLFFGASIVDSFHLGLSNSMHGNSHLMEPFSLFHQGQNLRPVLHFSTKFSRYCHCCEAQHHRQHFQVQYYTRSTSHFRTLAKYLPKQVEFWALLEPIVPSTSLTLHQEPVNQDLTSPNLIHRGDSDYFA